MCAGEIQELTGRSGVGVNVCGLHRGTLASNCLRAVLLSLFGLEIPSLLEIELLFI